MKREADEREGEEHPFVGNDAPVILDAEHPLRDIAKRNRQHGKRRADRNLQPNGKERRRIRKGHARGTAECSRSERHDQANAEAGRHEQVEFLKPGPRGFHLRNIIPKVQALKAKNRANRAVSLSYSDRQPSEASAKEGGRYWTRTSDPYRVKVML